MRLAHSGHFAPCISGALPRAGASIALSAAKASIERRLPMADSIMLTTAQTLGATFWTQDADFKGVEGVKYVASNQKA